MENAVDVSAHVSRLIDDGAWSRYQKLVWGIAALAFLAEGVAGQSMGLALPGIIRDWHLTRTDFALPTALGLLGFAAGALLGGAAGDRFGRRWLLIGSLVLLGFATMLCGGVAGIGQLCLIRILQGLGLGGALPASAAIIAEFAPARHRSTAMAAGLSFLPGGGIVAGELASFVLPIYGWRGVFVWSGIMVLAFAGITALFLPESPRFLATRPNAGDALRSVMARIGHPMTVGGFSNAGTAQRTAAPLRDILQPALRRNTILLWLGYFFVVLCLYSLFSWLPSLLADRGLSLPTASRAISSTSSGGLVGGLCSGWLIQRFGSRTGIAVLGVGAVASGLWLIAITGHATPALLPLTIAVAILGGTVSGAQTVLYALAANIYPPAMRSTGVGVAIAWGRIGAVLSAYSGVASINLGGAGLFFAVIAVAMVLVVTAGALISRQLRGKRS